MSLEKPRTKRLQVRIDPEEEDLLRVLAKSHHMTISQWVRHAIHHGIKIHNLAHPSQHDHSAKS